LVYKIRIYADIVHFNNAICRHIMFMLLVQYP
jgi:hypothetical protein